MTPRTQIMSLCSAPKPGNATLGAITVSLAATIDLNGVSYTVIGVLPPGAAYPATGEFWMPLSLMDKESQTRRVGHTLDVLGRLKAWCRFSRGSSGYADHCGETCAGLPGNKQKYRCAADSAA